MKTMCHLGYQFNGSLATHALRDMVWSNIVYNKIYMLNKRNQLNINRNNIVNVIKLSYAHFHI